MRAKGLAEVLDGRSAWTAEANEALEAAVPAWLRAGHLRAVEIPEEFLAAFVHGGPSFGINLGPLPLELRREMAWCMLRIIELGGRVSVRAFQPLALRLAETIDRLAGQGSAPRSLMDLPLRAWTREMAAAVARRTGALPAPVSMRNVVTSLSRCYQLVWAAYDTRPWWQREIWNPMLDAAIPRRPHEPTGRFALYFHRIRRDWLRLGLQWHFKIALETSALTWSTLRHRLVSTVALDAFLVEAGVDQPWLAEDPARVRVLMLDFLGYLRGLRARAGANPGQPLSSLRITDVMTDAEQFYFFMHDHREEAARALNEPGWLRLGPEHTGFWRRGEKPRPPVRPQERSVIDDGAFSQIMANLHLLGAPEAEGGLGDEQAMRVVMLLARTGRRVSEILMLDRDPLLALGGLATRSPADGDGLVARLRYQQTKIAQAPDTILVDAEVVAIVRAQQLWADRFVADRGLSGVVPKYLFLAHRMNRGADRPYTSERVRTKLGELAARLDIRDDQGRLVEFSRTHRFRHTRATSLLNAGVPIHVVQRYLGHLSPAMTMMYAETLAQTHEREFLRFAKVGADGRELEVDPHDLYDRLELDKRADRVLPNGWCLLPPRQVCTKGNACLTCDKFATDASYLPELTDQLERTNHLIEERQQAFRERTGQEMDEDNIWLSGRRQEQLALGSVIVTLGRTRVPDGPARAVRGGGVASRHDRLLLGESKGQP